MTFEDDQFFDPFNEGQTVERDIATMRVIIDEWESFNGVVDETEPNNCYFLSFNDADQASVNSAMTPGCAFFQVIRRVLSIPVHFANARRDIAEMKRLIKTFMWTDDN